jgi:hypothetical protein
MSASALCSHSTWAAGPAASSGRLCPLHDRLREPQPLGEDLFTGWQRDRTHRHGWTGLDISRRTGVADGQDGTAPAETRAAHCSARSLS